MTEAGGKKWAVLAPPATSNGSEVVAWRPQAGIQEGAQMRRKPPEKGRFRETLFFLLYQ
jgi:hypothetical protein